MGKTKSVYICQECGYESPKWMGKCPGCDSWNTFVEEVKSQKAVTFSEVKNAPVNINEIEITHEIRYSTKLEELDRVLGGGVVRGSLVLVGGDPGIGKSTLLLQMANNVAAEGNVVLYVSGEESAKQIKIRAERLNVLSKNLFILCETDINEIEKNILNVNPNVIVIDSIQTIYRPELQSAPGSVSQVREATSALMHIAKKQNIATFIVGHVTKEGSIAGPRVLEHMVDTVLYFEGERHNTYRVLRAVKNRFGSTNEIGVFEMKHGGLEEVSNPSEMLLSGKPKDVSGSCVVCTMEGTRPILIEVQALTSLTSFGMPRRMTTGLDYNRTVLLIAVLEKRVGMHIQNHDVYVNIAGGLKVVEPATDLGVLCSIASSFKNIPISSETVIIGEVGLTGEIRGVNLIDKRVFEAKKLGFKKCVIPKENLKGLEKVDDLIIVPVDNIYEALEEVLGG
ncbi:hypothetical protein ABG79_02111 [Caloramator mitchellensis]|uniref:DNA repair protein RadA n=1 Tax=Caloramator mitchellensis TaxID=908809 RepID=A0A0R3JUZ0_CALMK|nr:DNA repair protein RadA [Caloramator mitchellensis]KRQ86077.1 hypothetical protein ABG79_02111 [Caloramator mitchellensis]